MDEMASNDGDEFTLYDGDDSDKDPTYEPEENEYEIAYFDLNNLLSNNELENGNIENSENEKGATKENTTKAVSLVAPVTGDTPINCKATKNEKKRTRKRTRNEAEWKRNVNKKLCEHGQSYKDVKGKIRREREIKNKKNCETSCKFKCTNKINQDTRIILHRSFWELSNEGKLNFYNKNTQCLLKKRSTVKNSASKRQREFSYKYFFFVNDEQMRVCKQFFLDTLDISQRRVSYFHENKRQQVSGVPKPSNRGKHAKKTIPTEQRDSVMSHINSIARVESHYCRKSTKKEYFDVNLNLSRLYSLYVEWCTDKNILPVKESYYRYTFNYKFNIEFLKPKKDRCDVCELFRIKEKTNSLLEEESVRFNKHTSSKEVTKAERDKDRQNNEPETAVICFDLENVFALPRSNISAFFYSRKLNTYNLTSHCNKNKRAYCAVWSEGLNGRSGQDIAAALCKNLKNILADIPTLKKLIIWSDSCVPQNRNSIMTIALKKFMEETTVEEIVQKYCEPGHSSIQEIDNIHSQTEKYLKGQEIFSPLGLVRVLPEVNKKNKFKVYHLQQIDFKEFKAATAGYNFKSIPYASLKQIKYLRAEPMKIYYKLDHADEFLMEDMTTVSTRKGLIVQKLPTLKTCPPPNECLLPLAKVTDLYKLFKFLPPVDALFIQTLFKQYNDPKILENLKKSKIKKTPVGQSKKSKYVEYEFDGPSTSKTTSNYTPRTQRKNAKQGPSLSKKKTKTG